MSEIWLMLTFTGECLKFIFLGLDSIRFANQLFQSYARFDGKQMVKFKVKLCWVELGYKSLKCIKNIAQSNLTCHHQALH